MATSSTTPQFARAQLDLLLNHEVVCCREIHTSLAGLLAYKVIVHGAFHDVVRDAKMPNAKRRHQSEMTLAWRAPDLFERMV